MARSLNTEVVPPQNRGGGKGDRDGCDWMGLRHEWEDFKMTGPY